ncbi:nuclear factor of activated T-cells, cytoplasmic 2 isoform X2 [Hyperolius riggenbachi]|uniref:nuclear factor of activated T-cells, cytoplasmic 2 isoform X2 n=1 Tax=Hyperolius riggenbachi TaxID=752182 RepID=UPI0035A275E3
MMSYPEQTLDHDPLGSQNPNASHDIDDFDFEDLFIYNESNPVEEEPTPSQKSINSPGDAYFESDVSDYGVKPSSSQFFADPLRRYGPDNSVEPKYQLDPQMVPVGTALSPMIKITPSYELFHSGGSYRSRDSETLLDHQSNLAPASAWSSLLPFDYRESSCVSPGSSASSTSYISEIVSPCTSPSISPKNGLNGDDLCQPFQTFNTSSPRPSPIMPPRANITDETGLGQRPSSPRPKSRSSSPRSKRSRSPSPQASPRLPPREDCSSVTPAPLHPMDDLILDSDPSCVVPSKMWKSPEPSPVSSRYVYQPPEYPGPYEHDDRKNPEAGSILLMTPTWPKQLVPAIPYYRCPEQLLPGEMAAGIPVASLPALEWPLASQHGPYELQIEVQPKPHHRAHYETEGSRGAVKATTGGHPVVQLHGYMENKPLGLQIFIGTADERMIKPHAFYQVHRITGKTVTTTSYEKIIGNTKVLEMPLEPKTNMRATIDCAGILKLKNADIELRKGETDIGRKNTRVRLIFRVHIPQANGKIISLQAASSPVECSQRSAHELPLVERQDIDSCLVYGGQQMILTGQNFTSESKVVFTEKTPDGQQIWETEATVDKDKSQPNMLFVEVPEYRNKHITSPVKVNFQVINGKRKRSQAQHFTFHPVPSIKTEPLDEYPSIVVSSAHSGLSSVTQNYYSQHQLSNDSPSCLVANLVSCQQVRAGLPSPDSPYSQQSPSAAIYQRSKSLSPSHLGFHQPPLVAPQITIPDTHRSVLVHAGSPVHSPVNPQPSPVIHYSPNNHQMRCGSHQEFQHIMCSDFVPSLTRPGQAQRMSPSHYPTVIQQQSSSQRPTKPIASGTGQKEIASAGITVKQEQNLDQAYLDDELIDTNLSWIQNII